MFGQTVDPSQAGIAPATQFTTIPAGTMADLDPPSFEGHSIELESVQDSKITNVAVYSGRAEITRSFKVDLKVGQNQVHISGLPAVMDRDSLRVEGVGAGTIQEVSISTIHPVAFPSDPPRVKEIRREKVIVEQGCYRASQALKTLDRYIESLNASTMPASQLQEALSEYSKGAETYQAQILAFQDKVAELDAAIKAEAEKALEGDRSRRDSALNKKASIGVFAEEEGEVEIVLVYAVTNASWAPKYDIRVDTQANEKSVTLVYKCLLTQTTGEDWTDVSLALETVTPTFYQKIPYLAPWRLWVRGEGLFGPSNPNNVKSNQSNTGGLFGSSANSNVAPNQMGFGGFGNKQSGGGGPFGQQGGGLFGAPQQAGGLFGAPQQAGGLFGTAPQQQATSTGLFGAPAGQEQPHQHYSFGGTTTQPAAGGLFGMTTANAEAGGGNVSATFRVPNKITVPSDSASHNVTIVKLNLDASMSWASVPKKDRGVYLGAKIKNTSEYFLLSGPASVYVDGSFISRSSVPSVSPEESFNCPLGLDNSIKITYRPLSMKRSQTGIITQTDTYQYSRRITIHNTKSTAVSNVKLIDQFPVSEDSSIAVKLLNPALQLPNPSSSTDSSSLRISEKAGALSKINPSVKLSNEVVAKWDDGNEEEENIDASMLGKDGRINLVCSLPAQGKTNVTLQWEVSAPAKTKIMGI